MKQICKKVIWTVQLLFIIILVGTIGYYIIMKGTASWLDCAYMTIITIASVGYGEIFDLSNNPSGRVFTMILIICGAAGFLLVTSNVTALLVEGNLLHIFRRNKMAKLIQKLENHYILCGCGETGIHIVRECIATGRPIVAIEINSERAALLEREIDSPDFYIINGDATHDENLIKAGIEKARGLIACVMEDKDNLVITLYSRQMCENLRIISRCKDSRMIDKLRKAGADSVVSPNQIGGLRMASEMIRPMAVSFLDIMLRDKDKNLRVEEINISEKTRYIGKRLADVDFWKIAGLFPIALQDKEGQWLYNPGPEAKIQAGGKLVIIGNPEQRAKLEDIFA